MIYRTVLGNYKDGKVITEEEIISARAYAGREREWINKYGFWLLKLNDGWPFWIICEYVPYEEHHAEQQV